MNRQTGSRKYWFILGTIAIVVFAAGTAWAAKPDDDKRSPKKDTPAEKSATRENPPPAANRRADNPVQQPVRKNIEQRREPPVQRGSGETPAANREIRRSDSTPVVKKDLPPVVKKTVELKSATTQLQPPATNRRSDLPPAIKKDLPPVVKKTVELKSATTQLQPPATNRRSDLAKEKMEVKDAGGKNTGINPPTVNRIGTPDSHKDVPIKKLDDAKAIHSSHPGNKASVEDVRKRLGTTEMKKDVHIQPGHGMISDADKRRNMQNNMFQERLKAGELNRLTMGKAAKNLNLADQYRMYQKGDVARRLNLEKHGMPGKHPAVYRGVVSPAYKSHCMNFNYWGPAVFAGAILYPHWNPWVEWSSHHHCQPYWDPRPMWCRPVYYRPSPVWVYWDTPAWTPLPEVACGTWVDLKPVDVLANQFDLQLTAVRFVDPGHPEEKLGPRYRVWFRNNGNLPITQPFNIVLFAGNGERLAAGMPQAGVRVTEIEAGGMQSVDVRLPIEVYAMRRDVEGNRVPFSTLQVLVDANREVAEATRVNNGAQLAPADILPIDPASFELKPQAARSNEEILLAGEGFGPQPGRVLVQVDGQEMDGEILGWYDLGVQWTLPKLALSGPTEAEVVVIRGDGAAANPVKVTIMP